MSDFNVQHPSSSNTRLISPRITAIILKSSTQCFYQRRLTDSILLSSLSLVVCHASHHVRSLCSAAPFSTSGQNTQYLTWILTTSPPVSFTFPQTAQQR
jgi:hypothetical protein